MLFGEIIEPTTRALIPDDELEELPEYNPPQFEWEGNPDPPDNIDMLIFIETEKALHVFSPIAKNTQLVTKIKNESLSIYEANRKYIVLFEGNNKNLLIGEIVELLALWIKKAKCIHIITTNLISKFQPLESLGETPVTITRCLTNMDDVPYSFCERLDTPNLVKGFGACVLSYCLHNSIKASLWVIYTDNMPADSINLAEIVKLAKVLGFHEDVRFKTSTSANNLYI